MTAISLLGEPCALHSAQLHRAGRVYHSNGCPADPPACASCGARWMPERRHDERRGGERYLVHAPGCAYVEAMAS